MSTTLTGAAYGGSQPLANTALLLTAGAVTVSATAITFANNGILYTRTTVTTLTPNTVDLFTGAAFPVMAKNTAACLVFGYVGPASTDGAGTSRASLIPVVYMGKIVPYVSTAANSTSLPMPAVHDWVTPVAYVPLVAGATTAAGGWQLMTSFWDATGIVATPVNILRLPPTNPLTA